MTTSHRPELKQPVADFAEKLAAGTRTIPLAELAQLFGAGEDLLTTVASRGDIVFTDNGFSNDGPDLVVPAGRVELEIPMIVRGTWCSSPGGFTLTFPSAEFAPRACAQVMIIRKCFELKEMRATPADLALDFGNEMVNRRYTF